MLIFLHKLNVRNSTAFNNNAVEQSLTYTIDFLFPRQNDNQSVENNVKQLSEY